MKIKDGLLYIGGYWIGVNKGSSSSDILIGKPGKGGIKLKNFIQGKNIEIGSDQEPERKLKKLKKPKLLNAEAYCPKCRHFALVKRFAWYFDKIDKWYTFLEKQTQRINVPCYYCENCGALFERKVKE